MARQICDTCHRPEKVCFCHLIKPVKNDWPIYIIQHQSESCHPIGTAKIAQLNLENCRTHIIKDSEILHPLPEITEGILVYPGVNSFALSKVCTDAPRPLIFIDASWRKSRKIYYQSKYLKKLPQISFALTQPPRYRIRKEPEANYCSTLEAIVYALAKVENQPKKYTHLLSIMDWMIDQQIKFRDANIIKTR